MKRAEKRSHLIDVAAQLFNRLGYHAVGIDHVIAEAGVAKTTLYRHFQSKQDLIIAVLRQFDQQYRDAMRTAVENAPGTPKQKLLATFDFLDGWCNEDNFYGCPFISAAAEFGERHGAVFQEAAMHKRLVIAYLEELARAAGLANPQQLAEQINLLLEGATAVAQITGGSEQVARAKAIASLLIDAAETSRCSERATSPQPNP